MAPATRSMPISILERIEGTFHDALTLPVNEREKFIAQASAGDTAFADSVKRMLKAADMAQTEFLLPFPDGTVRVTKNTPVTTERPGGLIGHYKLLQEIGEGGFGTVWLADQRHPVRRRVALKIIKLGMDTKEVVARFEQERQALALMEHPSIAKVFDAGSTESGRPYFVMEHVQGTRITSFCDQQQMSTGERLRLFIQVCQAVQHAHQKGIIHRDLKPSNILVGFNENGPLPKIIDFGVAKATQQQRLTNLTIFTTFEQIIGTPAYMSPEQATSSGIEVDTRTDIYSLGVLLYELLTGRTPIGEPQFLSVTLETMRKLVREYEPKPPSTALSAMPEEARHNAARVRLSTGAQLVKQLRGDLDWIVMKALEKDRTRRYATVKAFQMDIERHLAHDPVLARRASLPYRVKKWLKRNKLATTALATLLPGLLVSIALILIAYNALIQAQARERKADDALKKSKSIEDLDRQRSEFLSSLQSQGATLTISTLSDHTLHVFISEIGAADLSSLRGAPVSWLSIGDPSFSNLMQVAALRLKALDLRNTRVTDLRPLLGMPLEELYLDGCDALRELPPFRGMSLRVLSMSRTGVIDIQPIAELRLEHLRLSSTRVTDLNPISGMGLRSLYIDGTGIKDLSPLRGMPLECLWISDTGVEDISPIQGAPIKILQAARCFKLTDLAPLRYARSLEQILLPPEAKNLDPLRGLPNLRFISFRFDSATRRPSLTSEEFWRPQPVNPSKDTSVKGQ